jgi:hypothetical protein
MNFQEWLLSEGKYMNNSAATCEHCKEDLLPLFVAENTKHIYTTGQLYQCGCDKSKIWTNSIRNKEAFLKFLNGENPKYTQGFCNDLFCGHCFRNIYPLQNGIPPVQSWETQRRDRYGCLKCQQNQNIAINSFAFHPEGDTQQIVDWYRRHQKELPQGKPTRFSSTPISPQFAMRQMNHP